MSDGLEHKPRTVAIGGLGAIGMEVVRALDAEPAGLSLIAVAASDRESAARKLGKLRHPVNVVVAEELAEADIVVEAAPAAAFDRIVVPAIERGRTVVTASVGAWLTREHLIERARTTGARIVIPTGAIAGLDAVRAAALGTIHTASIETRKPPASLVRAPYIREQGIDLSSLTAARRVFAGNALEAVQAFPANANVAAALALAGIGPLRTRAEIWADPEVTRNVHTIRVESDSLNCTLRIESLPSPDNPATSRLAPLSVIACLRGLTATMKVGS